MNNRADNSAHADAAEGQTRACGKCAIPAAFWPIAAALSAAGLVLILHSCSTMGGRVSPPKPLPAPVAVLTTTTTLPVAPIPPAPHFDAPPVLRVWLSDLPGAPTVMVRGACRIQARGEAQAKSLPRLGPAKVGLVSGGFTLGAETYMTTALDILPDAGAALFINNQPYSGALRIIRGANEPALINIIDTESYLLGVLGSEMPRTWPIEALKAQAVAARTYALAMRQERAAAEWDLMSTVEDQVYDGGNGAGAVRAAVEATAGQVMLHDNRLFPAFFHSTCGGRTMKPSLALGKPGYDFLEGVECGYCASSQYAKWNARVNRWELSRRLTDAGFAVGADVSTIRTVDPDDCSMRRTVVAEGAAETAMTIDQFRRALGRMVIKSGTFECARDGDAFEFTGRGLGHGAGMCQYGAKGMAEAGRTWREILGHYYRNANVDKIY